MRKKVHDAMARRAFTQHAAASCTIPACHITPAGPVHPPPALFYGLLPVI